jgi:hypothetical protein
MLKSLEKALVLMLMAGKEGQRLSLGEVCITPLDPVVAGSYGCWVLTYRVGVYGLDVGGGVKVGSDSDSDWGDPQFHRPEEADFMTVKTSGRAVLSTVIEGGYLRRKLKVTVHQHSLREGDEIIIVYGDRSLGGMGSRVQTFAEERRYFRVYVDSSGDGCFSEVPDPPFLQVIGGSTEGLSIIAPSQVVVKTPFSVVLRAMDGFGNPSYKYDGEVNFELQEGSLSLPKGHVFKMEEHGVHRFYGLTPLKPGVYRIIVKDDLKGIEGVSNPILCQPKPEEYNLYWGDLHGQVGLAEKISEYFKFPRDISVLDFASHQRNDHEVSKGDWEETMRVVKEYNEPGSFVAFLGFEWSGESSVGGDHNIYYLEDDQPIRREWSGESSVGGDHNIYYLEDDQPIRRSGHEMVKDKSDIDTDLLHIQDVYRAFQGKRILIVPHVGGRPADLSFHDPTLEPVIEVHSTHGTFEWFLREALKRGYT